MKHNTKYIPFFVIAISLISNFAHAGDELKILPLGNSITHGYMEETIPLGQRYGYRLRLFHELNNGNYNYDFIGHVAAGYDSLPVAYSHHMGIPGIYDEHVRDILIDGYYWKNSVKHTVSSGPYLETYSPDIILLHIGSNDVAIGDYNNLSEITEILDEIDAYEISSGKPILVFLAKIISTKTASGSCTANSNLNTYNANLQIIYNNRIAGGDHLVWVDMQCGAGIHYNDDMFNTYHPNLNGYDLLGVKWFDVIDSYNTAPVISNIPDATSQEAVAFTPINLNNYISDAETPDEQITWTTIPENPTNLIIEIIDNIAYVSPADSNWFGSDTIQFIATDNGKVVEGLKKSVSDQVVFHVTPVNDIPVIISQENFPVIVEDNLAEITISDLNVEDPDNDISELTLEILEGNSYTIENSSTVRPELNYTGTLEVNVRVNDLVSSSAPFIFLIEVSGVNDAPEITDNLPLSVDEDGTITILKEYLTIVDPDNTIDEQTLFLHNGENYSLMGNEVIPDPNFDDTLSVVVQVRDLEAFSNTYILKIHINSINDEPVFSFPVNKTAHEDTPYNETIAGTDIDGDSITITALSLPSWLSFNPDGNVLYGTPQDSDIGEATLSFRLSDGYVSVDSSYTLTIDGTYDPPIITSVPDTLADDYEKYSYTIEATDADNDELLYSIFDLPNWLSFNGTSHTIEGTPRYNDIGFWNVKIGVYDGSFWAFQEYTIQVLDINSPPTFIESPDMDTVQINSQYTYIANAYDVDEDDILTYTSFEVPGFLTFIPQSGVLIGIPNSDHIGIHEVTIGITDDKDTTLQDFLIIVESTNSLHQISIDKMEIYPTTVSDYININLFNLEDNLASIYLTDMSGKKILHNEIEISGSEMHLRLHIPELTNGIYLFTLVIEESVLTKKLIISNN